MHFYRDTKAYEYMSVFLDVFKIVYTMSRK